MGAHGDLEPQSFVIKFPDMADERFDAVDRLLKLAERNVYEEALAFVELYNENHFRVHALQSIGELQTLREPLDLCLDGTCF